MTPENSGHKKACQDTAVRDKTTVEEAGRNNSGVDDELEIIVPMLNNDYDDIAADEDDDEDVGDEDDNVEDQPPK
jgi:hypothetical protein